MSAYRVEVTCPMCGGDLHHVNTSRPWRSDSQGKPWNASISAIAQCPAHGSWQVIVTLASAGDERAARYKRKSRSNGR